MIPFKVILFGSLSIGVAVVIGLVRFRKMDKAYQPFVIINAIALLNELISHLLVYFGKSNAAAINIFNITEGLLWMWQFHLWGSFTVRKWQLPLMCGLLSVTWLVENVVFGKFFVFSSYYSLLLSFCLTFLAISQANRLIVREKGNLLKNARFLICSGLIIFYTYRIMVESFYVLSLEESNQFLSNIFYILIFVNIFVNIVFALAALWIPTRQKFSMQY